MDKKPPPFKQKQSRALEMGANSMDISWESFLKIWKMIVVGRGPIRLKIQITISINFLLMKETAFSRISTKAENLSWYADTNLRTILIGNFRSI